MVVNYVKSLLLVCGVSKILIGRKKKQTNNWTLLEGTVCQVSTIADKTAKKQEKYTELPAGVKQLYKNTSVKQINIVFDFLGGYHEELRKGLSSIMNTDKELAFLIERSQKWIIYQNANIVKKFYEYV